MSCKMIQQKTRVQSLAYAKSNFWFTVTFYGSIRLVVNF
ncbi:Unannotated [Lentimonas sp. CC4]|nr:Unannotated [Lentimonas sp. CC4]CAA7168878.1 Unannotated [Lentimonas sp. CC21]